VAGGEGHAGQDVDRRKAWTDGRGVAPDRPARLTGKLLNEAQDDAGHVLPSDLGRKPDWPRERCGA
jgi:hypothetical protein